MTFTIQPFVRVVAARKCSSRVAISARNGAHVAVECGKDATHRITDRFGRTYVCDAHLASEAEAWLKGEIGLMKGGLR